MFDVATWLTLKFVDPTLHMDKAVSSLIWLAISIALSYAASLFLEKKNDALIKDDKPTTLTKRGSFVTWLVGRRRVGPVFAWAGERGTHKERMHGGGKGGKKKKTRVYDEAGWHLICVGPVHSLQRIYQSGKILFEGPITSESHPSGTTVSLGQEGSFVIYWGEADQPVNTYLGDSNRVGVSSRWPNLCYVVWNKKRLGASPNWPMIEYVVERHPTNSLLSNSDPWMGPNYTNTSDTFAIVDHTNGVEGYGYFTLDGDRTVDFPPSSKVTLSGNSMADGDYFVFDVDTFMYDADPDPAHVYWEVRTRVYFEDGVAGANDAGTLGSWDTDTETGVNPAHAIAELLFTDWPLGLGESQSDWDMDSLEALGELCSDDSGGESIWSSWLSVNGDTAKQVLTQGLQDLGVLLPVDSATGKIKFVPIRMETGSLDSVDQDMLLDPLPTRETNLAELPADQLIFSFPDSAVNYRQMTIEICEDGHSAFAKRAKAKTIQLTICDHFEIASKFAERRSQEMLAAGTAFTLNTNRGCRELIPGDLIEVYGFEEALRVLSIQFNSDTSKVVLKCVPDFYGAVVSDFEPGRGGGAFTFEPTTPDRFTIVEVPETLGGRGTQYILVPRIRAHDQIEDAEVHLSSDDSTFTDLEKQYDYHAGGVLIDALSADTLTHVDEGPTFTIAGPDIGDVLDLSGDDTNWRQGRQLCAINGEIFFLKKVTAITATTYRLDGLIRARYDTRKEAHAADDEVFIFANDGIEEFTDILLQPATAIYVKSQPTGTGGPLPLDQVASRNLTLYGKGIVPPPPENMRLTAPFQSVAAYTTGDDITAAWSFYSDSGAGFRGAGEPQADESVEGDFFIQILDSSDVVKREDLSSSPNYTYTNANMVSDFGSEPATLKIRVSVIRNGYQSSTVTLTITKVS